MPVTKVEGGIPRGRRPTALVDQVSLLARATVGTYALLGLAMVVLLASNRLAFEPRVRDAVEGTRVLRLGHEAMLDQETGLRAFLLTGDDRFLEAYDAGRESLEQLTDESDRRLGTGGVAPRYLELRLARQAWIDGWTPDALAEGRRVAADATDDARQALLLVQGKDLFDRYRAAYESTTAFMIAEREAALDAQSRAISLAAGAALLATILLGAVSAARIRRLRLAVAGPMASILDHLEEIRAGNLDAERPAYDGLSEFTTIDEGLSATAVALRQARAEAADRATSVAQQNEQLAEVLRFAREVAGSLNLRYVLRGLCTAVAAIAGGHRAVVWLRDPGAGQVEAVADSDHPNLQAVAIGPIGLGDGAVGRAARFGRMEGLRRGPLDGRTAGDELAIPMVVGAEVAGVLQLTGPGVGGLPVDTVNILEALAVQAASAVGAARLHEHTEVLAMSDALTRLPNRRRLELDLATEVSISSRHGRPLGFAMIDVDHFKAYNDSLGHQAADIALQSLADLLASSGREGDSVYRYGGEELAVVMRETPSRGAAEHAERLRALVEHHFADPAQPRQVTVSVGVAAMPEHASTADDLVAAADAALYEAKRGGRNRVHVAPTAPS